MVDLEKLLLAQMTVGPLARLPDPIVKGFILAGMSVIDNYCAAILVFTYAPGSHYSTYYHGITEDLALMRS